MSYYGGGGAAGVSDHRLLSGRADAGQHPAAAVSFDPAPLAGMVGGDLATVQHALEALARRGGAEEIAPVAAVALGGFKAVAFRDDGRVEPADHDHPAHVSRLAGVTLAAAEADTEARVCLDGPVRFNGWSWTPGAPVFVGRSGALTQTPPKTGFVRHIGFASGRDSLLVRLEPPIRRT